MSIYVTAETVSPGHPDKIADLISDYVLTKALQNNGSSRVAVETFLTGTKNGGLVLVGGEISEIAEITSDDVFTIVKEALNKTIKTSFEDFDLENLSIYNELTPQSEEIRAAVEDDENLGAGDQGIMVGLATNKTKSSNLLCSTLSVSKVSIVSSYGSALPIAYETLTKHSSANLCATIFFAKCLAA